MIQKAQKKPVIVEVCQWTGHNPEEMMTFCAGAAHDIYDMGSYYSLNIKTLEGNMRAEPGDYIIKGVQGEFYPCKPDIFKETYETIDD